MQTLENGLKYKVFHQRKERLAGTDVMSPTVKQKGGTTYVVIFDEKDRVMGAGKAICASNENYNKKLGRMIALGRARKAIEKHEVPPGWALELANREEQVH